MADQEPAGLEIGRLRWLVTLASRVQTPDPASAGVLETITGPVQVHADVQGVGALTFYGGEDTDAPFTHRIFMRWHEYLDQTKAVLRTTQLSDGTARTEIFRVKRIKELGGRKRFVLIECVLEKVTTAPMPATPTPTAPPATGAPAVVLPAALSAPTSFATTITGDGAKAVFTILHGLNTQDVDVIVRDPTDGNAEVPDIDNAAPDPNTVQIVLGGPLPAGAPLRVIVFTR